MTRSIEWPITDRNWHDITSAMCWSGTLLCITPQGALVTFRRAGRGGLGPRPVAEGENRYSATYLLTDNGGEINVTPLGFYAHIPSVPVTDCGPETAAYRIAQKICGCEIDYDFDVDKAIA